MLRQALAQVVGADHVLADDAARRYASSDIFVWPDALVADLVVRPASTAEAAKVIALLEGKSLVHGRPAVYVCQNYTCKAPVTDLADLEGSLRK